ncbi:MAG: DUF5119 domain-containing protein [Rikenellaceae bacterium]
MKTMIKNISLLLCAAVTLASCERKPLYDDCSCYSTLSIPIDVDWETSGVTPEKNVTVLVYNSNDGSLYYEYTYEHNDNDIQSYISLGSGSYTAVVFNEKRDQVDYVSCVGYENLSTLKFESNAAEEVLRSRSTTRNYVQQPGDLAVAVVEGIVITDDMIVEGYNEEGTKSTSSATKATVESLTGVTPLKKNTTINIVAHVDNLFYANSPALADLVNLADGYYAYGDSNSSTTSTLQFKMGDFVFDDPDSYFNGSLSGTVTAFGTLESRTSTSGHDSNPVMLDILFQQIDAAGTETPLVMDVTNYITFTNNSDGSVTIDIEVTFEEALPEVQPDGSSGSSGLGSNVAEWEKVDVPLNQD